jgi:CelD/BcsL family acetyltransferase involved in cellulose biosynthesis
LTGISDYELEVGRDFSDFLALESEWSDFIQRCEADHPFNTHYWLASWWRSFVGKGPVLLISLRHAGSLVCCLPLVKSRMRFYGRFCRKLTPWVNTHSFRSGVLCDRNYLEALDVLASYLACLKTWDILDIPYLPRGYAAHEAFKQSLSRCGLRHQSSPDMCSPYLAISGSWEEYMAALSSSRRQTLRRKWRKFHELPKTRVEIISGTPQGLRSRLQDCWEVSRRTWKHEIGSSIAADPLRMEFYETIAASGWLVLGLAYLEHGPVAFEYNLLYKNTLYNLKLGYDGEHAKYSPGLVLRMAILQWAHEHNVRIFDYMGHEQEYKSDLGSGSAEHESLRIYGSGLLPGLAYGYEARLKPVLRRVKGLLIGRSHEGTG